MSLEEEIGDVLKALVHLQDNYLTLVNSEDESASNILQDYKVLVGNMLDWSNQLDQDSKLSLFNNRLFVKLLSVRPASLLIPALEILQAFSDISEDELAKGNLRLMYRIGERLASTMTWCVQSLQGTPDSRIYSQKDSRIIFEKSANILQRFCDADANLTRHIILHQEDIKKSLQTFINRYSDNQSFRYLYEAIDSEEECIREEEARLNAVVTIQATVKMWRQRKLWKKLRNGIVACQRFYREKRQDSDGEKGGSGAKKCPVIQTQEEMFLSELRRIQNRQNGLYSRYRTLARVNTSDFGAYLEKEKEMAVLKIQKWWRTKKKCTGSHLGGFPKDMETVIRAAIIIQNATRKWLLRRRQTPVWSQILAPRILTESRVRELKLEMDLWQEKNKHNPKLDSQDVHQLYKQSQEKYRKFQSNQSWMRLLDHRLTVLGAQVTNNTQVIKAAPSIHEYKPEMWSTYHTLPLNIAGMARIKHQKMLEKASWPEWKRRLDRIVPLDSIS